jgi:hypothetical protein
VSPVRRPETQSRAAPGANTGLHTHFSPARLFRVHKSGHLWTCGSNPRRLPSRQPQRFLSQTSGAHRREIHSLADELPPMKWSILRYGFWKEDHDGEEAYG